MSEVPPKPEYKFTFEGLPKPEHVIPEGAHVHKTEINDLSVTLKVSVLTEMLFRSINLGTEPKVLELLQKVPPDERERRNGNVAAKLVDDLISGNSPYNCRVQIPIKGRK